MGKAGGGPLICLGDAGFALPLRWLADAQSSRSCSGGQLGRSGSVVSSARPAWALPAI